MGNDMERYICAFDPGISAGALALLSPEGNIVKTNTLSRSKNGLDLLYLCNLIDEIETNFNPIWLLENIHSIWGTGKSSMFKMGRGLGNIEAALVCNGCEFKYITPKEWQKLIWKDSDIVYKDPLAKKKVKDTKATSLNAVKRLFPNELEKLIYGDNEKQSGRRTKLHEGIVDAVLIAKSQLI
jgi:hypothetical protein